MSQTNVSAWVGGMLLGAVGALAIVRFSIGFGGRSKDRVGDISTVSSESVGVAAIGSSLEEEYPLIRNAVTGKREKLKMVLVVRSDLGMGKGKMCAQCSHASVGAVCAALEVASLRPVVRQWEKYGAMKIAVKVDSEELLEELERRCDGAGLNCYLVLDAGKTQVAPNSKTVLAIGPGPVPLIDSITSHLKLL